MRAECVDSFGNTFCSWADYVPDARRTVTPTNQAPRSGSYNGRDSFGLWWSMASNGPQPFARDLRPVPTRVVAEIGREQVADLRFTRARIAPTVRVERVCDGGLVATLFLPGRDRPAPGVMVLGGSEGGISSAEETAALLASRGFAALAVAYFGVRSLPSVLAEVPLEYFEHALRWLSRRPELDGHGVGIIGSSRGGELALILASSARPVRAVIGLAASGIVWPGYTPGAVSPRAAWTRNGAGLPFAIPQPRPSTSADAALALRSWFARPLRHEALVAHAEIPVERGHAAVMLISGRDDRMWPASQLADRTMRRLSARASTRTSRHVHIAFARAGHRVGHPPGLPEPPTSFVTKDGLNLALGGSREGNARSAQRAWPRIIRFFSEHLNVPPRRVASWRTRP